MAQLNDLIVNGASRFLNTVLASSNVLPSTTNTYNLGSTSQKWANVYATTFTGNLSGNADTADTWKTSRVLTIGNAGKSVNGSASITWTLSEIGAATASHTHGNITNDGKCSTDVTIPSGKLLIVNSNTEIGTGPTLSTSVSSQTQSTKFLREDGTWAAPTYTTNVDTKSKWNAASENTGRCIAFGPGTITSGTAYETYYDTDFYYNPSTNILTVPNITSTLSGNVTGNVTGNCSGSSGSCTGNAASASKWQTARILTVGNASKSVDGLYNITWSLSEIGVAGYYLPLTGGTVTGSTTFSTPISGDLLGNATTSDRWKNSRTITIGSTGKAVDGSANVSWTLAEIGAQAAGSYKTTQTEVTKSTSATNTFLTSITQGTNGNITAATFTALDTTGKWQGTANYASSAGNADTVDSKHASDFVPKKYSNRFYPFIAQCNGGNKWYKITLPYAGLTFSSWTNNTWEMISFDITFGGPYNSGASGTCHLAYYMTWSVSDLIWTAANVLGLVKGYNVNSTDFLIKYDITDPGYIYIRVTSDNNAGYNGLAIINLHAHDTAANRDQSTITITTTTADTVPTGDNARNVTLYFDSGALYSGNAATSTKAILDGSGNTISTYYLPLSAGDGKPLTGSLYAQTIYPITNNTYDLGTASTKWANVYATTFYGKLSGNADTATTATKIGTSNVGSGSQPIYLNAGTPTVCTYSLGANVPTGAVFTDTKVTQTPTTTDATYEVLFSETADNTAHTEGARKTSSLTYNPSTRTVGLGSATIKYNSTTGALEITC